MMMDDDEVIAPVLPPLPPAIADVVIGKGEVIGNTNSVNDSNGNGSSSSCNGNGNNSSTRDYNHEPSDTCEDAVDSEIYDELVDQAIYDNSLRSYTINPTTLQSLPLPPYAYPPSFELVLPPLGKYNEILFVVYVFVF